MALRDRLAQKASPFLQAGDVVQQAFRARILLPGTNLAKSTYVVVGTQDAVLILKTSIWSTTKPKELVARVPKTAPISLEERGRWSRLRIGDRQLRVAGRSTKAEVDQLVNSAHALRSASAVR